MYRNQHPVYTYVLHVLPDNILKDIYDEILRYLLSLQIQQTPVPQHHRDYGYCHRGMVIVISIEFIWA